MISAVRLFKNRALINNMTPGLKTTSLGSNFTQEMAHRVGPFAWSRRHSWKSLQSYVAALLTSLCLTMSATHAEEYDLEKEILTSDVILVPSGTHTLKRTISIPNGKRITGVKGKSIIYCPPEVATAFLIEGANDITLEDLVIRGSAPNTEVTKSLNPVAPGVIDTWKDAVDLKNIGEQTGIRIVGGERIKIDGLEISNFSKFGLHVSRSGRTYNFGIQVLNCFINNNYCGIKTDDEAERSQYIANFLTLNQIGFYMDSGTNMIDNCAFNANRVGLVLNDGYNHAHGNINSSAFTHNSLYGVVAHQIQFGQKFDDCKFGFGGDLYIYQSKGIVTNNCQWVTYLTYFVDGRYRNPKTGEEEGINIAHNNISNTAENIAFKVSDGGVIDLRGNISFNGDTPAYFNNR